MTGLALRLPGRFPRRSRRAPRGDGHFVPVLDHLDELRARIWWCVGLFAAAFVAWYVQREWLLAALAAPLPAGAPQPVTLSVAEPLLTSIRVSGWAAVGCTTPIATWHAWRFLAPAVDPSLRTASRVLGACGVVLAAMGATFGYFVALEQSLAFLIGHDAALYDVQLRASELYRFSMLVVLASAMVFQLPLVLIGLVRFGIVTTAQLRYNRRIGWAFVAVLAVLMPGVDPVLTAVTFVPLLVLWEGTIVVARVLERRWRPES